MGGSINKRHKELNLPKKEHGYSKEKLLSSITWIKGQIILFSINRMQSKPCQYIKEKHQKKLDATINNKTIRDGIKKTPNSIIANLTDMELTESEVSVLKYGLKHRLLTRAKKSEMILIVEDIQDQILRNDVLKENHISKHRLQTALKAFIYNQLDIDYKEFGVDEKRINTIRNLQNKCMILKPDKGQGVALIKKSDYKQFMERLFPDQRKFKVLNDGPSIRSLRII